MQAIVWHDHFLKERNMDLPIMRRSRQNMDYYMSKDPGGTFVALDGKRLVGSIVSHSWGGTGWFGPLEVHPLCQGRGIGKSLVMESVDYLKAAGCTTIGCETMAGSPRNIAFYRKMGFRPVALSNVLYKRLGPSPINGLADKGLRIFQPNDLNGFRSMWSTISPGLDYSSEVASSSEKNLGDIWVMSDGKGHAITHTYEMFDESQNAIVKLLAADDLAIAGRLLDACEMSGSTAGKTGMFLRTYDASPPDLEWFFARGYELQGNSVRFILHGEDESADRIHVSCWSG